MNINKKMTSSTMRVERLLLLLFLHLLSITTKTRASLVGSESTSLRRAATKDGKTHDDAKTISFHDRFLEAFTFLGSNGGGGSSGSTKPAPGVSRVNPGIPGLESPAPPPPAPVSMVPATIPPTVKPTDAPEKHEEIGETKSTTLASGTPFYQTVLETLDRGANQIEPLFGANSTYKVQDFITALQMSYYWETSASTKKSMGPIDRKRDRDLQLRETGMTGTARPPTPPEEPTAGPLSAPEPTARPLSAQEQVWEDDQRTNTIPPQPEPVPTNNNNNKRSMDFSGELASGDAAGDLRIAMAHVALLLGTAWHGGLKNGACDEPNFNATDVANPGCGQNGLNYRYPFDGFQEEGFGCFQNDQEWLEGTSNGGCPVQPQVDLIVSDAKENPLFCGMNTPIFSRDCCWWGRGMLQMTHQCDYGDYQAHWGSQADAPPTDICANPGQVCSDEFPTLRFLTGLYLWVRDVIHAEDPNFNFISELTEWVQNKMDMRQDGNFVDRVGGVLVYGDADRLPPDYRERRHTVEAALDSLMSLAPPTVSHLTYGNIARCKPAVQSTIMEDQVAANAVDGMINNPDISHTQCEENPWWQVDLESPHQIYTIAIVNRQDCCFERLDHVKIELLDEHDNPIAENNTIQHDPNMEGTIHNVWTVDFETPPVASKVKVSVKAPPGQCDFLNIAEVQVLGYCQFGDACLTGRGCHMENVAKCKPTKMSSESNSTASSIAVDGQAASEEEMHGDGVEVAKTGCDDSPYWEVDLLSAHNISMVAVFIPSNALVEHPEMGGMILDLIDGETGETVNSTQMDIPIGGMDTMFKFEVQRNQFEIQNNRSAHLLASIVRLRLAPPYSTNAACATLALAEVEVYSDCWQGAVCAAWPSCSYENVAECKAATQSSTFQGGVAWKAIDGHQAMAHTKCEDEPWWEVDLLGDYEISEVILFNRQDCCYERLNGVVVELKDREGNTVQSVQHQVEKEGMIESSWSAMFDGTTARVVRVMVQHHPDHCHFLNLQDIQVMQTCDGNGVCRSWSGCERGNVAQCKPTTQSSTFYSDVAAQGVDGDESLAHTACETNPWWGVNLLEPRSVSHVVVHNREDCCYERLNNLKVQLYDEGNQVLAEIQHNPELEGLINTMWIATFDPPVPNVKDVFLSTEHPEGSCEFLNMAEVEVMSECVEGDSCMTGFGCDEGNVAKCKPAHQSSTMARRANGTIEVGVAGHGVDGNDALSHTECEQNPWWEVDLLSMREINEIIVHNRQDCCFERLNGILVELKDDNDNVIASAQHDPNTDGMIEFSWIKKFDSPMASRVRISNRYPDGLCDHLNLADVEVISTCIEGDACLTREQCVHGNVAQCKPARQISTMNGEVAGNAINGREALAHTKCEENPWWEVDLLGEYQVSEVILFNRLDCCQDRLNGVLVELLDHNGTALAGISHNPSVDGSIEEKWAANFDPHEYFKTAKVRVSLSHNPGTCEFLALADVQVMSVCQEGDACLNGDECKGGNVAQCKKAEQSTTFNGAAATKATDGTESLTMTKCEENPWWVVDLETRRDVKEVVVYNRRDCCLEELNGVTVELMDSFGNVLNSVQHDATLQGVIDNVWSTKFSEENVRFVKVSNQNNGTCSSLRFSEVQVISVCEEDDACFTGFDCENENLLLPTEDKE